MIRSASLSGYVELATQLQLDVPAMLRAQGLNLRMLARPEVPISLTAARRLLEASALASGVEDFGLRMAQRRRLSNLGPISLVLRASPTAREALAALSRYLRLVNASLITQVEDHGDVVLIREELLAERGEPVRQSIELALGVMVRILTELLGPQWRPRSVWLAHRAPHDLRAHRAMLGPTVKFDAPFNAVVCAATEMAAPLPEGDTGMAAFARAYLDQALTSQGSSTAQDRVRELVAALLPGGGCTVERVAQHLGQDRRTLHRHLSAEGSTFTAVLATVRQELAERQLSQSDRSMAELADLLGFASASAFAFWFKRHYGCSASEWRLRVVEQSGA